MNKHLVGSWSSIDHDSMIYSISLSNRSACVTARDIESPCFPFYIRNVRVNQSGITFITDQRVNNKTESAKHRFRSLNSTTIDHSITIEERWKRTAKCGKLEFVNRANSYRSADNYSLRATEDCDWNWLGHWISCVRASPWKLFVEQNASTVSLTMYDRAYKQCAKVSHVRVLPSSLYCRVEFVNRTTVHIIMRRSRDNMAIVLLRHSIVRHKY